MSFARFASALSSPISHLGITISNQTIKNWEDGVYHPSHQFILQLFSHAPQDSWQHAFALDILAVQWPELYPPGSEIGLRLLKQVQA